ncbi:MAG: hypothetical protein L7G96_07510 [Vulcanisaeta sp.]|nr:hypothetical protein [Vulcanisaeta sp.]
MFVPKAEVKDPDVVVAGGLGAPVGLVTRFRRALETTFGDAPAGVTHVAAFVLNYSDTPEFKPFVDWLRQHKSTIMRRLRVPRYIVKTLEQMSTGGCSPILHGRAVRFSDSACLEALTVIAAAILFMVKIYAGRGIWVILDEGVGAGDVYVLFKGDGDGQ